VPDVPSGTFGAPTCLRSGALQQGREGRHLPILGRGSANAVPTFLNRIRSLNEEETEKLTFEELIAYSNIMHKIDPRSVRHPFEETFIDRGLTNSDVLRLLEGAKGRAKWKQ
jgi:hypothetical protein